MTKKANRLEDYVTAGRAAHLLTIKSGRRIAPSYVRKLKNVNFVKVNATTKLYNRDDILACNVRQKKASSTS